MPYIITTRAPRSADPDTYRIYRIQPHHTRRAVATLDEARGEACDAIKPLIPEYDIEDRGIRAGFLEAWHDASLLPETGGTIGPLPDGTVIEVEFWGAAKAVNWMVEHGHDPATEDFITTFNADNT